MDCFYQAMHGALGVSSRVTDFDVASLYSNPIPLDHLQQRFSEEEIERAVHGLANNKACRPDGLPNKFAKQFWGVIKEDVMTMFDKFFNHDLDLADLNRANIIFIPKKEQPQSIKDYRPISKINLVPKIISKTLANRLAGALTDLIAIQQTTFIRGRYIAENFLSTREIVRHLAAGGHAALLAKIDFSKTFNSLNWNFLTRIMCGKGFPLRWIKWISNILSTSSSRVLLNRNQSQYFTHKRGLRQGDPLSSTLFILAVDALQAMVSNINATIPARLSSKLPVSMMAL